VRIRSEEGSGIIAVAVERRIPMASAASHGG
jgi:hypothetical protein